MKKYLLKRWFKVCILLILIVVTSLIQVSQAYIAGYTFNSLIKLNLHKFVYYMVLMGSFLIIYLILSLIIVMYKNYLTQIMINDIRENIMDNITKSSYQNFYKNEIGTYISWLSNDISTIEKKGFSNIWELINLVVDSVIIIFAMLTFHWSILIFTITFSLITIYLPKIVGNKVQQSSISYSKSLENFTAKNTSFLQGFDTLLTFNKLNILKEVNRNGYNNIFKNSLKLIKYISLSSGLGGLCNILSQLGILILSGILIVKNIMSVGGIITLENFTNRMFNSIDRVMMLLIDINISKPLFKKFEDFEKEIEKNSNLMSNKLSFNEDIKEINLENISYSYDKNKQIISNFNYIFESRKKYVIVGKSGSGKTTLLKLLTLRLDNYSGDIKINGKNVKDFKQNDLLDKIVYISQSPYIFTDTLKFNITLGQDFSDEKVKDILKLVKLEDLIDKQDGISYELKENGNNLSGGQKQRIALARGLIRNKKILLLDEVTSSLDKENANIIENIVLNDKELTVIMISHRVEESDKEKFDKIIDFPLNN